MYPQTSFSEPYAEQCCKIFTSCANAYNFGEYGIPPIKDNRKKPLYKGHTLWSKSSTFLFLTSEERQPLYKGQNVWSQRVHYLVVPLYSKTYLVVRRPESIFPPPSLPPH